MKERYKGSVSPMKKAIAGFELSVVAFCSLIAIAGNPSDLKPTISRFMLGVTPAEPGFKKISIAPNPGPVKKMSATVPTQAGSVRIEIDGDRLSVASPAPAAVIWLGKTTEIPGNEVLTVVE